MKASWTADDSGGTAQIVLFPEVRGTVLGAVSHRRVGYGRLECGAVHKHAAAVRGPSPVIESLAMEDGPCPS